MFSFLRRHCSLVWNNVSVFVPQASKRSHTEEAENGIKRFLVPVSELLELDHLYLFSRKKLKNALDLPGVKSSIDIREAPRLQRFCFFRPVFFFFHRLEEIERFASFEPLHVPMRESTSDRVSQDDQQFDF